eukprot:7168668-Alexandrium_andersonii.AAC.1
MSASLVGSEMCIRDRPPSPQRPPHPKRPRNCLVADKLQPQHTICHERESCLLYTSDAADDM